MTRNSAFGLLIGFTVAVFACALYLSGFFSTWQDRLADSLFAPRSVRKEIVLIAIDDKSIQSIGRFPWDRSVYATLLEKLDKNPAVVAIDVSFPEPSDKKTDEVLASAFATAGNILIPLFFLTTSHKSQFKQENYLKLYHFRLPGRGVREM